MSLDMNMEQDDVVSSLINVSHLTFHDLDSSPVVLARAVRRASQQALGPVVPDAKFESALIRDIGE